MFVRNVLFIAGTLAVAQAFTIPEGQPDGIFAVLPDQTGALVNHVQLKSWPAMDTPVRLSAKLQRQAPTVTCGTNKGLDKTDYDAAKASLDKLCSAGGSLPAHQSLYEKHGNVVTFLCSNGAGGSPPPAAAGPCTTPISAQCGNYNSGWVTISQVNITYGIDLASAQLCGKA
ncbi:hypothetical protein GQ53DRAFT_802489 [Thozetella sp. PMI_491]|nr:hypothetical protein GQ53DRAFT_802489 [Thozetella sp. PMI_491]